MAKWDVVVASLLRSHRLHLTRGLRKAGRRVLVLESSPRRIPGEEHRISIPALGLAQARRFVPPALRDPILFSAYRKIDAFAARHCHLGKCFWGWSGQSLKALRAARRRGLPGILDCGSTHIGWFTERIKRELGLHGTNSGFPPSRKQLNTSMAAEYDAAEFVCVPSRFVAATFVDAGLPEEKICLNPYGVDVAFWNRASDNRPTATRPFRAVFTGSMLLRKGLWYLLEAWKKLSPDDSELMLVGNIYPDGQRLMKNLPPGVKWCGRLNHSELREIYRQTDLFVLPSLEEGLARAVLEAMAAGLPVLVTYETGVTDIVVDGADGWVIPSADTDALAQRLEHAIQNREDLALMGDSALDRVAPYTWEAYGERAAALLEKVESTIEQLNPM